MKNEKKIVLDKNGYRVNVNLDGSYTKRQSNAYHSVLMNHRTGLFAALISLTEEERIIADKNVVVLQVSPFYENMLDAAYAAQQFSLTPEIRAINVLAQKGVPCGHYDCGPMRAHPALPDDADHHVAFRAGERGRATKVVKVKAPKAPKATKVDQAVLAVQKENRIQERVESMTDLNLDPRLKSFIAIDPKAMALSRRVLAKLKRRHGERKVLGRLKAYAKKNGTSALSTMTVEVFESTVL